MVTRKFSSVCLATLVTLLVIFSASSAQPSAATTSTSSTLALQPWEAHYWTKNLDAYDISTAFGGFQQFPLLSYYTPVSYPYKEFAYPKQGGMGYACGPGNAWTCTTLSGKPIEGKTSRLAVYNYPDTFKVGVAYQRDFYEDVWVSSMELMNNLDYVGTHATEIVDFNYFLGADWTMLEEPALAYDGMGNPRLAFILRYQGDRHDRLFYAYKKTDGIPPTNPCNPDPISMYQCDLIYTSEDYLAAPPRLVITESGKPRIGFSEYLHDRLMYAYPQSNPLYNPNCGPDGISWRCIIIDSRPTDELIIDPAIEMAIGPAEPQFAYRVGFTETGATDLYHARFVGKDGNCGRDYGLTSISPPVIELVYQWKCSFLNPISDSTPAFVAYSIAVDSSDFPVIAYNFDAGLNYHLRIVESEGRAGGRSDWWTSQDLDGSIFSAGRWASIAINKNGLGFIAYIEDEDYSPNFKIIYQQFRQYIPRTMR